MTTQYQKELIADYIMERAWAIAEKGEIHEDESIFVEDMGGLNEDCEIDVRFDGDCWDAKDRDLPSTRNIDLWYEGKATFYSRATDAYLYSVPVSGRITDFQ